MLITASMGCNRPIVWVSYYYSLRLYRYTGNHLQGNDASKIRVDDFISFLTCTKPGLFCLFAQVVGTHLTKPGQIPENRDVWSP